MSIYNEYLYSSGLVLEGGGLRALYSSGVLDAFIEAEITFPYVIGVSAGSCNGVSYIAKNRHRMRDLTINYSRDKRYMSLNSMIKHGEYLNSGWIFGELAYDILPLDYDEFEKSGTAFCAVTTNASTGKPEYFYPKNFRNGCEELKASCAMPIVSKPVKLGADYYYDGGLTNSIPLQKAFDDGCKRCVTILTQHRDYIKHQPTHINAMKKALKKYPLIADALEERHKIYNAQKQYIFEQEKSGNTLVICPSEPLNCPTLEKDTDKLWKIYNMGYRDGKQSIDRVRIFLNQD